MTAPPPRDPHADRTRQELDQLAEQAAVARLFALAAGAHAKAGKAESRAAASRRHAQELYERSVAQQRQMEADNAAKLRQWEAKRPERERGQAAFERANRRRAAELGRAAPAVAASALWTAPEIGVIW